MRFLDPVRWLWSWKIHYHWKITVAIIRYGDTPVSPPLPIRFEWVVRPHIIQRWPSW